MKKLALLLSFFIGWYSSASALDTIGNSSYTNFVHKSEMWVCTSLVLPLDMAVSAFNTNMIPDGRWVEIFAGSYLDGSVDIPASSIKIANASNIFNAVGRTPGIYDFVYISGSDNFCGMSIGQKSIFRIYLVPEITGFYISSSLCKDDNLSVDFNKYVPTEIKSFAELMGWSFKFKDASGTSVTTPVQVSGQSTGLKTYFYEIDDSAAGKFQGKFNSMDPLYACETEAKITHQVTVKQSGIKISDKSIAYCFDNLISGSSSYPVFTVDLNSILSIGTATGEWKRISTEYGTVTTDGVATIQTKNMRDDIIANPSSNIIPYTFEYLYIYNDCNGNTDTAKVTIQMADEQVLQPLLQTATKSICRAMAPGHVNLLDYFGISVPSTSGIWTAPDGSLSNGIVDISLLSTTGAYQYHYIVTSAVEGLLCGLQDLDVILTLKVSDISNISSGEAQLCLAKYNEGSTTINLSDYVSGLSSIVPSDINWYAWETGVGFGSTPISNSTAYPVNATTLKPGVNQFKFVYGNECGEVEGKLYLSVTDRITNFKNKTVYYCFTDAEAENINLYQLLGVVGMENKWDFVSASTGATGLGAHFDRDKGIFKGSAIFDRDQAGLVQDYSETYEFKYIAGSNDCATPGEEVTITIILTENLVD